MKRLVFLAALAVLVIILAGASALAVPNTGDPLADSSIPDDEMITCQAEAADSSPSATIGITMYAVDDASSPEDAAATVTLRAGTAGDYSEEGGSG